MTPMDLVQAASPKIASLGAAFYFDPATLAKAKGLDLDGFRFYMLGRGGVLGDVEAPVIHSAFGYFNPGLVAKIWNSAKEKMAPRDGGRTYMACAQDYGRTNFGTIEGLDAFCDAAAAIDDAADDAGLALYAGISAEPRCDDLPGRAMQLTAVLRELRGSAHLLAVRASGLDAAVAHAIKRPDDVAMFGWAEAPTVTDDDRARLDAAEKLTDELVLDAYGAVDEAGAAALMAGLEAMEAAVPS